MIYLSTLMMSLLMTISLIPVLVRLANRLNLVDVPNARSVHVTPIPRCGGIAILLGTCVPILIWRYSDDFLLGYLLGGAILMILGIVDDWHGVNYRIKFLGQILAATVAIQISGIHICSLGCFQPDSVLLPVWGAKILSIFVVVAVTNAINLSDGLDGLAGGLCLMSVCCVAFLAYLLDNLTILFISASLIGAIFGFLRYNTHPASLFMGDTGSMFLGFSIAVLSIALTQESTPLSPLLPLAIVGFPVMDTVTVMVERISHGKSPFHADKNHFHHKLLRIGLRHSESVLTIYLIQSFLILSAIVFRFYEDGYLLLGYALIFALVQGVYIAANHTGWLWGRSVRWDAFVTRHIRPLFAHGLMIKMAFWPLEKGLPLFLLLLSLIPGTISAPLPAVCALLMLILFVTWFFQKQWRAFSISLSVYFIIPFLIYDSVVNPATWVDPAITRILNLLFPGLIVFVFATLKLTKRKKGFKTSPMDFLILFIAVILPFFSGTYMSEGALVEVISKTLVLFFSYEVLIGELREQYGWVSLWTLVTLAVVLVRGMV